MGLGIMWWRGGSLRTWHVGERLLKDSATLVRKETKKRKKKHIWTVCLQMVWQGMVPAGVAAKGRRWQYGVVSQTHGSHGLVHSGLASRFSLCSNTPFHCLLREDFRDY